MPRNVTQAWKRLDRLRRVHGPEAAREKLELLHVLEAGTLSSAAQVLAFHDLLCFLRAYPDSPEVLAAVVRILGGFAGRRDLRRHRVALADTGVAGTALHEEFYWFSAEWLSRRCPGSLFIDWPAYKDPSRLEDLMFPVLEEPERLAYDGSTESARGILDILRAPDETDETYLVRCLRGRAEPLVIEHLYDRLGIPLTLYPGARTPARTHEWFPVRSIAHRTGPFAAPRGSIVERIRRAPRRVKRLSRKEGRRLYELGRGAMITRGRDLFAFMHANPDDAFLAEFEDGLAYACMGMVPDRRHLLYGQLIGLMLSNGVPIGYVQACALFGSAEINFNIFENFRDAEASRVFTSALALFHHVLCVDAFTINTQQLGEDNPEALSTGAWWFYFKHGFRPLEPRLAPLVDRECRAKRRNPRHRSSMATLERLCQAPLHLFLGRRRRDVLGVVDLSLLGQAMAARVHRALGVSGSAARKPCAEEARRRLGVRGNRRQTRDQKEAWARWGPLIVALPGIEKWTRGERRAVAGVIHQRGGRSEVDYVQALRAVPRLERALLRLSRGVSPVSASR